jgi:predicted TPR repeat methyltransferase
VASNYDLIMSSMGHPDPVISAQICKDLNPDAKIFDLGCGTGLVGDELIKLGFKKEQIWGCDASQGMLDVAAKKDSYSELRKMFLG